MSIALRGQAPGHRLRILVQILHRVHLRNQGPRIQEGGQQGVFLASWHQDHGATEGGQSCE